MPQETQQLVGDDRYTPYWAEVFIHDDGRVNIPRLEVYPVLGCNIRCQYCGNFSPYRQGVVPLEKIVYWFETWSKKVRPNILSILGGEPFLHTDLASIILESRRMWGNSKLELLSNGFLIPQTSQSIINILKKMEINVIISDHSGADLSREKIVAACSRLKENGVLYELRQSNAKWRVRYQLKNDDTPIPFQSSPRDAWSFCRSQHHALSNNRLYKCPTLACIIAAVEEGALSSELWKDALTYTPLFPTTDAISILKHFRTGFVKECSVCSDTFTTTEPKQMPHLPQRIQKVEPME